MSRSSKPKATHEDFVFRISAPALSYSFSVQHDRRLVESEPFDESESVTLKTECIWPGRFAGREGQVRLYPEPGLAEPGQVKLTGRGQDRFGYIKATKSAFESVIWLPPPAPWKLAQAAASGLIRSMLTNGLVEPRGMNRVTSVSFYGGDFDPAEYVG